MRTERSEQPISLHDAVADAASRGDLDRYTTLKRFAPLTEEEQMVLAPSRDDIIAANSSIEDGQRPSFLRRITSSPLARVAVLGGISFGALVGAIDLLHADSAHASDQDLGHPIFGADHDGNQHLDHSIFDADSDGDSDSNQDREPLPTPRDHTPTPVPSDTPEPTATNEPLPTPRDHTPTPVGETPTVTSSPTPPPSATPTEVPTEEPTDTATATATATKPATATATEEVESPTPTGTPEEEEEQVQLLVKKRIDDGDGIFDDGDKPWAQDFTAWVDSNRNRVLDENEQSQKGRTDESGLGVVTFKGANLGSGTLLCAEEINLSDNLMPVTGKNCDLVDDSGSAEARLLNANVEGHAQPTPPQPTVEAATPTVPAPPLVPSEMPRAGTGPLDSNGERALTTGVIAGVGGLLGLGYFLLNRGQRMGRELSIVKSRLRIRK